MIAFAVLLTFVVVDLMIIWLLAVRLDRETSFPDSVIAVILISVLATVCAGAVAGVYLGKETEPHYYPVIINVPVLAEKP